MEKLNPPSALARLSRRRSFLNSRRRFLQQLGGAGLAALASPLRAEPKPFFAYKPTVKRTAGIPQVQHIVLLMQENHSFDHYFGSYSGLPSGYGIPSGYTSGGQAPFHFTSLTDNNSDPNHSWSAIHTGYANGAMNGWYSAGGIDALGYYTSADLAYYYSLIPECCFCVNFCCGMLTDTQPNRMVFYSGTSGGNCCDCINSNGTLDSSTYPNICDLLQMYNITFKNYNFGVPNNYCYLALWSNWASGGPSNELNQSQSQFFTDCSNGTLANVTFITNESPNDEHPPEDIQTGEGQMQSIIQAVQASPLYSSTVILLTWDEGGGFFDHVPPTQLDGYGPGVRVPMFVISPMAKIGFDTTFQDFGSIHKFIEAVFGLPTLASINHTFDTSTPLTNNSTNGLPFPPRDKYTQTGNMTQCFNFSTTASFTLAPSPGSVSVQQGASGTSTITATITGGFNSAIALSASGMPSGVTASFSPSSIPAPGSGTSTLTLTVSSSAAPGTYSITVTGTGGGVTQTATVSLTVTSGTTPSFTMTANPTSVTVQQGASGTSSITTTVTGGFNSAVALSASGMPSGVTASFSPTSIPAPGSGSSTLTLAVTSSAATGTYPITVTGSGGGVTQSAVVTLTVSSGGTSSFTLSASPSSVTVQQGTGSTTTITSAVSGGFNNAVALSASGLPSGVTATFTPSSIPAPGSGSSTLTLSASSSATPGTYSVTITGSGGGVTQTTTVSVTVTSGTTPNFTLSASPSSVSVMQGASGTSSITVAVSGGFNSSVALSASGMPSGVTASFSPSSLPAPGSGTSILTLSSSSSAAIGTYSITITGAGGGVTQTTAISLTVSSGGSPGFTLSASPGSVTVQEGSSGTSTITATPTNGFNSSIALSSSGAPSGVTVSFNPSSIPAPGNGSSVMTMSVSSSAAQGTYIINIIGTGFGGVVENTSVTLTVTGTSGTNLILNGGFETGSLTSWKASGSPLPAVTTAQAHSGSYSCLVGKTSTPEINGSCAINQSIKLPSTANKITLTFWYWPGTNDSITYAYQEVLIQNPYGQTLATAMKVCNNTQAWTEVTFDLTAYKGKTIRVYFAAHGNGYSSDYIYMYVDDVSVTVM